MAERTDKDYAIEHAGYLAQAARNYRSAVNAEIEAQMEYEEDASAEAEQALNEAIEAVGEAGRRLESAIYEFEKRRDRAAASGVAMPPAYEVVYFRRRPDEPEDKLRVPVGTAEQKVRAELITRIVPARTVGVGASDAKVSDPNPSASEGAEHE